MSWCDLDLTFELAIVTLIYKILQLLYMLFHNVNMFKAYVREPFSPMYSQLILFSHKVDTTNLCI